MHFFLFFFFFFNFLARFHNERVVFLQALITAYTAKASTALSETVFLLLSKAVNLVKMMQEVYADSEILLYRQGCRCLAFHWAADLLGACTEWPASRRL